MASTQEQYKSTSADANASGKRILLIEGPDDEHVVKSICGRLKLGKIDDFASGKPGSQQEQGKEALLRALPVHLSGSNIHSLGIILDADGDDSNIEAEHGARNPGNGISGTWQTIAKVLKDKGYLSVPDQPYPEGTVIPSPSESGSGGTIQDNAALLLPRVGIWIMPNNRLDGTLETFLRFLVPEDDKLLPHAERIIDELPNVEPSAEKRFKPIHRQKALMHTWLAWQQEPGKPYGQAITARYLDTSLPIAQTFAVWLQKTFWPEP